MARKRQQSDDPWSGFVDVLSNVVMVVTFLVIILGIAMLALSQQVAKSMASEMLKAEETRRQLENQVQLQSETPPENPSITPERVAQIIAAHRQEIAEAEAQVEEMAEEMAEAEATRDAAQAQMASMSRQMAELRAQLDQQATGSQGLNRTTTDRPLLQQDEVEGNTDLTVRSRRIEQDFETIIATAEEIAEDEGARVVENSDAVLKVAFARAAHKIDKETTDKITGFFSGNEALATGLIELRTFASSSIGSVSEARRLAFYRGMAIRNAAVGAGIVAGRIKIVLRESESEQEADSVWVFMKPL